MILLLTGFANKPTSELTSPPLLLLKFCFVPNPRKIPKFILDKCEGPLRDSNLPRSLFFSSEVTREALSSQDRGRPQAVNNLCNFSFSYWGRAAKGSERQVSTSEPGLSVSAWKKRLFIPPEHTAEGGG